MKKVWCDHAAHDLDPALLRKVQGNDAAHGQVDPRGRVPGVRVSETDGAKMKGFWAFSSDELARLPDLKTGARVKCPHCRKRHRVFNPANSTGKPSTLQFYRCGSHVFLAGVYGKNVMGETKQ
jgi:hypothetical protein